MQELIVQPGGGEGQPGKIGSDPQFADLGLTGADEFEDRISGGAIEVKDRPDRPVPLELGYAVGDVAPTKWMSWNKSVGLAFRAIASRKAKQGYEYWRSAGTGI